MNILHHKSWHVRTKSNMERVRRDERKAAEEEQRVLDRQIQAENERRINQLRARADDRMSNMFGGSTSKKDVSISDETGHVNLFQDLEREERKNHGVGNADYAAEKAEEKKEWESKMGIQVFFADNTNDLNKKKEWYEEMPLRKMDLPSTSRAKTDALPRMDKKKKEKEKEEKKKHKKDKKKKKKHRHRDRSEERRLEEEYDRERKQKMAKMRDERLKRERAEKSRTYALLHPEEIEKERKEKEKEETRGKKTYNSQFNPEFFRK